MQIWGSALQSLYAGLTDSWSVSTCTSWGLGERSQESRCDVEEDSYPLEHSALRSLRPNAVQRSAPVISSDHSELRMTTQGSAAIISALQMKTLRHKRS